MMPMGQDLTTGVPPTERETRGVRGETDRGLVQTLVRGGFGHGEAAQSAEDGEHREIGRGLGDGVWGIADVLPFSPTIVRHGPHVHSGGR